jgi:transcriptional regulator with XRE-family HTH domain
MVLCQAILYIIFVPQPPKNRPKPLPQTEMPLGKRIARLRSQEALAEVMGISRKQVTDYETGKAHLNDEMIVRFALTLQVTTDELLGVRALRIKDNPPSLRHTRRLRELMQLPEAKKRAVFKILDDLIRANS